LTDTLKVTRTTVILSLIFSFLVILVLPSQMLKLATHDDMMKI